jgi:transcriptional regulator with XRE-family HTH domain
MEIETDTNENRGMTTATLPVGNQLREWRQRRRLSQMELALEADVSTRHVSFVETGRSKPSRDLIARLSERLDIPLRERNLLMVAAGYAPVYPERPVDDPELKSAREAVETLLTAHEPFPAVAVDRHWNLVRFNKTVPYLLRDVASHLTAAPVNVLRLSLHPDGLAPRILNLAQWRDHLLSRLRRQIDVSGDAKLVELLAELEAYPAPETSAGLPPSSVLVPMRLRMGSVDLDLISTTTIFGTPVDVTLSELAIELFYPANPATTRVFHDLAGQL